MQMILKLTDVPSEKIGPLHTLLSQDVYKCEFESKHHSFRPPEQHGMRWARILRAKSDDGMTYVVDIALEPGISTNYPEPHTLHPPIETITLIYELLDIHLDETKEGGQKS